MENDLARLDPEPGTLAPNRNSPVRMMLAACLEHRKVKHSRGDNELPVSVGQRLLITASRENSKGLRAVGRCRLGVFKVQEV